MVGLFAGGDLCLTGLHLVDFQHGGGMFHITFVCNFDRSFVECFDETEQFALRCRADKTNGRSSRVGRPVRFWHLPVRWHNRVDMVSCCFVMQKSYGKVIHW